jgi:hypothetical protein
VRFPPFFSGPSPLLRQRYGVLGRQRFTVQVRRKASGTYESIIPLRYRNSHASFARLCLGSLNRFHCWLCHRGNDLQRVERWGNEYRGKWRIRCDREHREQRRCSCGNGRFNWGCCWRLDVVEHRCAGWFREYWWHVRCVDVRVFVVGFLL